MFPNRFFPARFFADRYFPPGESGGGAGGTQVGGAAARAAAAALLEHEYERTREYRRRVLRRLSLLKDAARLRFAEAERQRLAMLRKAQHTVLLAEL